MRVMIGILVLGSSSIVIYRIIGLRRWLMEVQEERWKEEGRGGRREVDEEEERQEKRKKINYKRALRRILCRYLVGEPKSRYKPTFCF